MNGRLPALFGTLTVASLGATLLGVIPVGFEVVGYLLAGLSACAGIIFWDARKGTVATALFCAGASAYLLAGKIGASGSSACNIDEVFNCDKVNASAASEINGIPITLLGFAFYTGLFIAGLGAPKPRYHQMNGLFALISLTYSAYLAYQSKLLGAVCLVCISIYIGNALLFGAALRGLKDDGKRLFAEMPAVLSSSSFVTLAASFVVLNLLGMIYYDDATRDEVAELAAKPTRAAPDAEPQALPDEVLLQLYHRPRGQVSLDGSEHVLGDKQAPYLIVEWADYGCPHCALASKELDDLVKSVRQVQVRFKAFPLSSACNPAMERDTGPERCHAAIAAECAGEQGRFYELNHLIFMNQSYLSDEDLTYMAEQSGLDMERWSTCMDKPEVRDGVIADAVAGATAGVTGTPAMFLKVPGGEFVELSRGALSALRLIEHHQDTGSLPPAPEPPPLPY